MPRLQPLLAPRSIAVVGASERPSPGRAIMASLARMGFEGKIWPVHPRLPAVLGVPCFASIADLPEPPDVVAICLGVDNAVEAFRQAAARGARAAVIYSAGFAEAGSEEGRRRASMVTAAAREHGTLLCGPNGMGILSPHTRSSTYLHEVFDLKRVRGNVALISQSGSICISMAADCRRFGFSYIISTGNEMVLTAEAFLESVIEDPNTRVAAMFLETARQPERLVAALDRAATLGKPVIVLKAGKSARAAHAVASHTGGLAGEAPAFSALLRAHRAIEVADLSELTEVLAAAQGRHMPAGPRLAIVTGSGGQAELLLDLAEATGIRLDPMAEADRASVNSVIGDVPGDGNPLDAWGNGQAEVNYPHALRVLGASAHYDAVAFTMDGMDGHPLDAPEEDLPYAEMLAEAALASPKPFYGLSTRAGTFRTDQERVLRAAGVGLVSGASQGLRAIAKLAQWAQTPLQPRPPRALAAETPGRERPTIHEHDAKQMLAAAGLPVPPERLVHTLPEALAAAEALGFPVVLKAVSDVIPHKTEHGLVALDLSDAEALRTAWATLQERLAGHGQVAGILVQPMLRGGVEVIAGVKQHEGIGPVMAFGVGGTLVEVIGEVALRALPLRQGEAEALIAEARLASALLAGVRGAPPSDLPSLAAALYALSDFAVANAGWIAEVDVNPIKVFARGQGCLALDAIIIPRS
ncbi:acetate--CoA ligase family protein [Sabulicella rubraurantiaca]|uniref:acetate--CoA ligase family protein n=1 Tax=Sabulicella rubraurantiaca TaxID=2811429 RepID=UPI001A977523|nr:acetate--CoA ligase family protein [Sabulicella rubraurantiaca]